MYLFVEGSYDEDFFSILLNKYNIEFKPYQYSQKNTKDINKFLKVVLSLGETILFVADSDGASASQKKNKILKKHSMLNSGQVFIVEYEIESWYYAGANDTYLSNKKIKKYKNTDNLTKEMFRDSLPKKYNTFEIMSEMLSIFNCDVACRKNKSFNKFFDKYITS